MDDESKPEDLIFTSDSPEPDQWTSPDNPPYSYWLFYMYANLVVLNNFRRSVTSSTIQFPHFNDKASGPLLSLCSVAKSLWLITDCDKCTAVLGNCKMITTGDHILKMGHRARITLNLPLEKMKL